MDHSDLPDPIRRIYPPYNVGEVDMPDPNTIRIRIKGTNDWDTWNLLEGEWKYFVPESFV